MAIDTSDTGTRAKIVWGLYILSVLNGITAIIGVVLAYAWRDTAPGDPLNSHFGKAIRVFWISLAIMAVGFMLTLIGIGVLIMAAAGIYMVVMAVIGLLRAFDGKSWT
jgi:uncharacterized membrane protein